MTDHAHLGGWGRGGRGVGRGRIIFPTFLHLKKNKPSFSIIAKLKNRKRIDHNILLNEGVFQVLLNDSFGHDLSLHIFLLPSVNNARCSHWE